MARVIRIDDDVWAWLRKNARPLEDTPNSVLRRLAGLPEPSSAQTPESRQTPGTPRDSVHTVRHRNSTGRSRYRTNTALNLQEEWAVSARHVLYHKDGTYYNHLLRFPGGLFDPHGYVLFRTEQDYLNSPYLKRHQQLHVPGGISSIPGYVRKR